MKIISLILLLTSLLFSQQIVFDEIPSDYQLYPRNSNDSAKVVISGKVVSGAYNSIFVKVFKDDNPIQQIGSNLEYEDSSSPFLFTVFIHAELSEYSFQVYLDTIKVAERINIVCGDAFLINGQSNALAFARDNDSRVNFKSEWFRSFGTSSENISDFLADSAWGLAQGKSFYSHLAVGAWGLRLGQLLVEKYNIPICIINGAVGGTKISYHLRNNSNHEDITTGYGRLLSRAVKAKLQNNIKAIFWHQGESDIGRTYITYKTNFEKLYTAWMEDYLNVEKIYLFQIRPANIAGNYSQILREYQREIGEEYDNVEIMSTVGISGYDGLHYYYSGYKIMAEWIFPLVARDFYGCTDTLNIEAPNIIKATYNNVDKEILLLFDNVESLVWPSDTLESIADYFYCDGAYNVIESGRTNKDSLFLRLKGANFFDKITYLPNRKYHNSEEIYVGPWVRNSKGIAVLSFFNFPIVPYSSSVKITAPNGGENYESNSKINIEWNYTNVNEIKIEYSTESSDWQLIANNINSGLKLYAWDIPEINSQKVKVRITDINDCNVSDESNNYFSVFTATGVNNNKLQLKFDIKQNYPNPFNPSTVIKYTIPKIENEVFTFVQLKVYDILGNEVATLVNTEQHAGSYEVEFNASAAAKSLSSGIYFYRLQAGSFGETRKMVLLR